VHYHTPHTHYQPHAFTPHTRLYRAQPYTPYAPHQWCGNRMGSLFTVSTYINTRYATAARGILRHLILPRRAARNIAPLRAPREETGAAHARRVALLHAKEGFVSANGATLPCDAQLPR